MKNYILSFLLIGFLFASCNRDSELLSTRSYGTIEMQGHTTSPYGTHILTDVSGNTLFALFSEEINLDDFIGKTVSVKGHLMKDYPVGGGPKLMQVTKVKE